MVGRAAFPLFFLLIGRNQSSRIWLSLIISAIIIQGTLRTLSYVKWYDLRQLNILPAAIIVKLLMGRGKLARWSLIGHAKTIGRTALDAPTFGLGTVALDAATAHVPGIKPLQSTVSNLIIRASWFILITLLITSCSLLVAYTKWGVEYGAMTLGMALLGLTLRQYKSWRPILCIPIALALRGLKTVNSDFKFTDNQRLFVYGFWILWVISVRAMSYHNKPLRLVRLWDQIILFLSKYAVWIYVFHFLVLMGIVLIKLK